MSVEDEIAAWEAFVAAHRAELPTPCPVTIARQASISMATPLDDTLASAERQARSAVDEPEVQGEWTLPATPSLGMALYVHGAAQTACVATHRRMMGDICRQSSARVLCLEYRRPPEHRFPAPLEDVLAALAWIEANGDPMNKVVVAGDSFGAMLVLSATLARKRAGLPLPAGIYLPCPKTDYSNMPHRQVYDTNPDTCPSGRSMDGYFLSADGLSWVDDSVQASPFLDDLAGLPPVLIQSSTGDTPLNPHAIALRDKLLASGNACTYQEWERVPHFWMYCPQFFTAASEAISEAGAWIRARLQSA